jgi:predicted nucleic acid-binding protein
MKYVFGASVALKWVLPEKDTPKAVRLRNAYRQGLHELLAPDIFSAEVAHALARAERRKILHPPEGARRLLLIHGTAPRLYPYMPRLGRALEIASQTRSGVYDCPYVALAEREGCELVTADDKLLKNLAPPFPFLMHLTALP